MAFAKGNQYGKRPRYKTPEEMKVKIDQYFEDCEGKPLVDHNGDPILDRWGNPVVFGAKPPTVTGLALALGFKTRQALILYQAKKEFVDLILEAKSRVEEFNERQLYTRDGQRGAQFSLQHNFGWKEDKTEEKTGPSVNIINDIPQGTINVNTDTAVFNPLGSPDAQGQAGATQPAAEEGAVDAGNGAD